MKTSGAIIVFIWGGGGRGNTALGVLQAGGEVEAPQLRTQLGIFASVPEVFNTARVEGGRCCAAAAWGKQSR